MASAECKHITGVWGWRPQLDPGQSPLKLETFLSSRMQMRRKFAHFCYNVNCLNMLLKRILLHFRHRYQTAPVVQCCPLYVKSACVCATVLNPCPWSLYALLASPISGHGVLQLQT